MKQNAAIIFELEETVVLKHGGKRIVDFCPRCQTDVEMLAPDVLALLAGSSEREIFRLIEAGLVHFVEPHRVLACPNCYRTSTAVVDSSSEPPQIVEDTPSEVLAES